MRIYLSHPFADTILELEEAFKVLIVRNKVLLALVKKCGGTAPSFTEPKIFNCIVTSPLDENDLNELYVKQNGRPPKNGKGKGKRKLQTLHDDEEVLQKKKKMKLNVSLDEWYGALDFGFYKTYTFQKKGDKKKLKNSESDKKEETAVVADTQVNEENNGHPKTDSGNIIEKVVDDKPTGVTPIANSESKESKGWLIGLSFSEVFVLFTCLFLLHSGSETTFTSDISCSHRHSPAHFQHQKVNQLGLRTDNCREYITEGEHLVAKTGCPEGNTRKNRNFPVKIEDRSAKATSSPNQKGN